jgi:hypothetical protein
MNSHDPACEDLAELFLDDPPQRRRLIDKGYTASQLDVLRGKLAERIQEAVEDWFAALEEEEDGHGNRTDHR